MRLMWLALLLACAAPQAAETALQKAQGAAVSLGYSDGKCNGTEVGAHVILTAAHCFANGARLERVDGVPVQVGALVADGADHVLVTVDLTFAHAVTVAGYPVQGEDVFVLASPGTLPRMYRRGYVAGESAGETQYVMPIFFGDSGAAVFDGKGNVVAVVSGMDYTKIGPMRLDFSFSYKFHFTTAQWAEAIQ